MFLRFSGPVLRISTGFQTVTVACRLETAVSRPAPWLVPTIEFPENNVRLLAVMLLVPEPLLSLILPLADVTVTSPVAPAFSRPSEAPLGAVTLIVPPL